MTFNVFITQPEMEEQGESVFREDGWLPTTFALKTHHLFLRLRDRWAVGFPPACSLPCWGEAKCQEDVHSLAARGGNPTLLAVDRGKADSAWFPFLRSRCMRGQAGRKRVGMPVSQAHQTTDSAWGARVHKATWPTETWNKILLAMASWAVT